MTNSESQQGHPSPGLTIMCNVRFQLYRHATICIVLLRVLLLVDQSADLALHTNLRSTPQPLRVEAAGNPRRPERETPSTLCTQDDEVELSASGPQHQRGSVRFGSYASGTLAFTKFASPLNPFSFCWANRSKLLRLAVSEALWQSAKPFLKLGGKGKSLESI